MLGADASSERGDHLVIGAAALRRVDCLGGELQVLMASGGVEIVVLQKHGGRQDDVGIARGIGHELFVDAGEEVLARKAATHFLLIRRNGKRVRILDQHGSNGRAAFQRLRVAGQDRADPRLVQTTNACVSDVQPLDHRLLQLVDAAVAVEGASSLVRPGAGDRRNAQSRVHVCRAVALARETKTKAEEAAFRPPDERGEFLDLRNRERR